MEATEERKPSNMYEHFGAMFKDFPKTEFDVYGKNVLVLEYDPMFFRVICHLSAKDKFGDTTCFAAKVNATALPKLVSAMNSALEVYKEFAEKISAENGIKMEFSPVV